MKSDLAKARDKWLSSVEGETCCVGAPTGQYLKNRLTTAFLAGYKISAERIKELEAENKELKELISRCHQAYHKTSVYHRKQIKELEAENKKLKNQKKYIYKKELAQLKMAIEDAIELMDDEPAKKILEQALKGG